MARAPRFLPTMRYHGSSLTRPTLPSSMETTNGIHSDGTEEKPWNDYKSKPGTYRNDRRDRRRRLSRRWRGPESASLARSSRADRRRSRVRYRQDTARRVADREQQIPVNRPWRSRKLAREVRHRPWLASYPTSATSTSRSPASANFISRP